MTTDFLMDLEKLKGVWMIGGAGLDRAPSSWSEAVQQDSHPELAILAIAGQLLSFALKPVPSRDLHCLPLLPSLPLPCPPESARQEIRHLVKVLKWADHQMVDVVRLLESRGYALNPLDYLPKNYSSLPDWYAPWEAWARTEHAPAETDAVSTESDLNSENWDLWRPSERRLVLANLRREQPEVARQLIREKLPTLNAEERFKMIELLAEGLGSDDQSILEQWISDRSNKVRKLVQHLLARLGAPASFSEESSEFAQFYTVSNVDLQGSIRVAANALKTAAQKKRRGELAANIALRDFAAALGLPDEDALVAAWENVDAVATDEFVRIVAATGSENAVVRLTRRLESLDGITAETLQQLFCRMSPSTRRDLLPRILAHDDASFAATLRCCGTMLGEISWEQLLSAPALQTLLKIAADHSSTNVAQKERRKQGLIALGLVCSAQAAQELIVALKNAQLFVSDPLLAVLRLNVCLPPHQNGSPGACSPERVTRR